MKKSVALALIVLFILACCEKKENTNKLSPGNWRGKLQLTEKEILPFNFSVSKTVHGPVIEIYNAEETVIVDEIEIKADSIRIQMPVFEGYLSGTFSADSIEGQFIKESLDRYVPFTAEFGTFSRFDAKQSSNDDVSGIWETTFDITSDEPYPAKGIFLQDGNRVTGTFRTKVGDFRYLEGVMDGDNLKLSAFDGAHAFLFTAKVADSTMSGSFYSGNHSIEQFEAKRNDGFELPDADTLTFLRDGYDDFSFEFPNAEGQLVSLEDTRFKEKVVLVQIMGTWCPNCLDETKFYMDYLKKNPDTELQFVALAFEYAKTRDKALTAIKRLKDRVGVSYPILLAQYGSSNKQKANEQLPMLNHVLSYPTTIYIDKSGSVRKIHTGFNGPATGEKHEAFKKEFETTVQEMLAE